MALLPKPFHELLKMEFIIPPYQRGYRWDNEQVNSLLDDLYDFIKSHKKTSKDKRPVAPYYCLQPIAVVRETPDANKYIVVDGQQRLTTIYLLLHYLRMPEWNYSIYTLNMRSRDVQHKYINECLFKDSSVDLSSNIDIFYLEKAYEAIRQWFDADGRRQQHKDSFRKLFAYEPDEEEEINDVRVIWYEIPATDALEAFRRLNYGKIPLTSTELVKALLLQSNDNAYGKHSNGAPYRRALEWDEMEHTLQKSSLWSMLSTESTDPNSRFDIILDFVADNLNESLSKNENGKCFTRKDRKILDNPDMRDYFNYNVINEYISINGDNAIADVWEKIRNVFNLITNWYDNREWYHLIGLLRILPNARKSQREMFRSIYNIAVDKDGNSIEQPAFSKNLKRKIGEILLGNIPADKRNDYSAWIESLNYHDNAKEIVQVLKVLNVKEAIDETSEGSRFAFDLFDRFNVTSLEHIHPQNITTNASWEDFKEWVARRSEDFSHLSYADFERILSNEHSKNGAGVPYSPDKDEIEKRRSKVTEAISILKSLTADAKHYKAEENQTQIQQCADTLDSIFGELSAIKENELHSIGNLALVDQPTNSCLSNYFLDRKRDILMDRHNHGSGLNRKTYAPPATRKVFCKEYSRSHPGDMRLWTRDDRRLYKESIMNALIYFMTD